VAYNHGLIGCFLKKAACFQSAIYLIINIVYIQNNKLSEASCIISISMKRSDKSGSLIY